MFETTATQSHIVVVDTQPKNYHDLTHLAGQRGLHLHFFTNAKAAIEFAPRGHPLLWMVNTRLPDMGGLDLVATLRQHAARGCLCAVADQYQEVEERQACGHGADAYLCKDATKTIDCQPILDALQQQKSFNVLDGPPSVARR